MYAFYVITVQIYVCADQADVCGSVRSDRVCADVCGCVRMCADVCGSVRKCADVYGLVYGSGEVRHETLKMYV